DSRGRCAMVSMTCWAGWRTQIAAHRQRLVVHARAVFCELIRRDGTPLHVIRVRMAASAGVRYVDRVDGGTGIAGRAYVVDAMTIRATCYVPIPSCEA